MHKTRLCNKFLRERERTNEFNMSCNKTGKCLRKLLRKTKRDFYQSEQENFERWWEILENYESFILGKFLIKRMFFSHQ